MSLNELKARNAQLKAELAKLEALAKSLDNKEEAKVVDDSQQTESEIKAKFDRYDTDKSGFIDAKELQGLSIDLGNPLDEKEVQEVLKVIDTSGDGKISFNEFFRWYTLPDRAGDSSFAKLAKVHAAIQLRKFDNMNVVLARQLSAAKPNAQPNDAIHLNLDINLMADAKAASSVTIATSTHDPANVPGQFAGHVKLRARLLPGVLDNKDTFDKHLAELKTALSTAPAPVDVVVDAKENTLNFITPLPLDPFAQAAMMGIDVKEFWLGYSVKVDNPVNIVDMMTGGPAAPQDVASALAARVHLQGKIKKAIFDIISQVTGAGGPVFAKMYDHLSLVFAVAETRGIIQALATPIQARGYNPIAPVAKVAEKLLTMTPADLRGLFAKKVMPGVTIEAGTAAVAARHLLGQLVDLQVETRTGLGVKVAFENFFSFQIVPADYKPDLEHGKHARGPRRLPQQK